MLELQACTTMSGHFYIYIYGKGKVTERLIALTSVNHLFSSQSLNSSPCPSPQPCSVSDTQEQVRSGFGYTSASAPDLEASALTQHCATGMKWL